MSKYNWPALIESFEKSGLSQARFCQEQKVNPKYFNSKYSQHRSARKSQSGFLKAELDAPLHGTTLGIQVGRCKVICPHSMPIESFVTLVHQLA